jgi:hypothetical protein
MRLMRNILLWGHAPRGPCPRRAARQQRAPPQLAVQSEGLLPRSSQRHPRQAF